MRPKKQSGTPKQTPQHQPRSHQPRRPCYRPGSAEHRDHECHHKDSVCHFCKKKGHVESICFAKKRQQHQVKNVHHEEEPEPYPFNLVKRRASNPIILTLLVNNVPIAMELDTGAGVSIIPLSLYNKHFTTMHTDTHRPPSLYIYRQPDTMLGIFPSFWGVQRPKPRARLICHKR